MSTYSPSHFFPELFRLQHGLCAWCGKALSGDLHGKSITAIRNMESKSILGKYVVDHNHRCCPGWRTCGNCVRGAVCNTCNITHIQSADWAYENGAKLPRWMHNYVTRGEGLIDGNRIVSLDTVDESKLPALPSAEDEYLNSLVLL